MSGQTWIVIKLGGTSVSSRRNWDNALAKCVSTWSQESACY